MPTTIFTATLTGSNTDSAWRIITPITGAAQGQIRVTFQAASGATFATAHCSIGIWTGTKADTTATPVELTFTGAHGFSLGSGASIISDWVNLSGFTASDKLVVCMDISSGNGATLTVTGSDLWFTDTPGTYYNLSATPAAITDGAVAQVAGFNKIEVQAGADVAMPPGTQPSTSLPPIGNRRLTLQQNRTWTWNGLEYTLADVRVSGAAPLTNGRGQLTGLPPIGSKRDYPYFQRSWIQNHVENTLFSPGASQFLPPGKSLIDRPFVPAQAGLFWTENLLQSTLAVQVSATITAPVGKQFTDRPPVSVRSALTWTNNLLQSTLDVQPVITYQPTPFDWQITRATPAVRWDQPPNLLPLGTEGGSAAPFVPNQWLVLPAQVRIQPQPQPNQLPLGAPGAALTLPDGKAYTDRPYVGPYPGKTWIQQLLPQSQSEFLPTPIGVRYTDRPYVAPYSGKSWTQQLLPESQSEFLPTPVGAQLTSRTLDPARPNQQTWTKNLLESTLDGSFATGGTPVGAQLTAKPPQLLPRSGQTWFNNLLESTLDIQAITGTASPVGVQLTELPSRAKPQSETGRTWLLNLLESTLAPPTVAAVTNFPVGAQLTTRPYVAPTSDKFWAVNLLQTTLFMADANTYQPTPFDWQVTPTVRGAIWNQPPNMALLSAPGTIPPVTSYQPTPFDWQLTYQPTRKALFEQPPNIALQNPEPFILETRAPSYAVRIVAGQFNRSSVNFNTPLLMSAFPRIDQQITPYCWFVTPAAPPLNRSFTFNNEALLFASFLPLDTPKNQYNWPLTPSVRPALWNQVPTLLPLATTGASQFLPNGGKLTDRPLLRPVTRAIWNQPPNMVLTEHAGSAVTTIHQLPCFTTVGRMRSF